MGNKENGMIVGVLGDPMFFADASDLGDIRLDIVDRASLDPGQERLSTREDFAAGNG